MKETEVIVIYDKYVKKWTTKFLTTTFLSCGTTSCIFLTTLHGLPDIEKYGILFGAWIVSGLHCLSYSTGDTSGERYLSNSDYFLYGIQKGVLMSTILLSCHYLTCGITPFIASVAKAAAIPTSSIMLVFPFIHSLCQKIIICGIKCSLVDI